MNPARSFLPPVQNADEDAIGGGTPSPQRSAWDCIGAGGVQFRYGMPFTIYMIEFGGLPSGFT